MQIVDSNFKWLDQISYSEGLKEQEFIWQKSRFESHPGTILGLEHPFVVTLGRRLAKSHSSENLPIFHTDRGGEATLHSEGQLVIYPVVKIKGQLEVREWVSLLLRVTQKTLQQIGIESTCQQGSGLWTSKGKIAFLGLRIKEGISLHGLSINIANDLSLFKKIIPCGVQNASMDSVSAYKSNITTQKFFDLWKEQWLLDLVDYKKC